MSTTPDETPTRQLPNPDRPEAPEPFSHASAVISFREIISALPRNKVMAHLEQMNEVGIVLDRLFNRAGVHTNKGL